MRVWANTKIWWIEDIAHSKWGGLLILSWLYFWRQAEHNFGGVTVPIFAYFCFDLRDHQNIIGWSPTTKIKFAQIASWTSHPQKRIYCELPLPRNPQIIKNRSSQNNEDFKMYHQRRQLPLTAWLRLSLRDGKIVVKRQGVVKCDRKRAIFARTLKDHSNDLYFSCSPLFGEDFQFD